MIRDENITVKSPKFRKKLSFIPAGNNFKNRNKNTRPENISTIKYLGEILAPQYLHFPKLNR